MKKLEETLMLDRRNLLASAAAIAIAGAMTSAPAMAQSGLPDTISWTAYDVGSAGYNQSVAIGGALRNEMDVNLRILPGRNDIARQIPLRDGRVDFSATGLGASFFSQEGMFEFGEASWGPQEVRVLIASNADSNLTIGAAGDLDIETVADLEGKRVAWVVGSPSLNQNIGAILSFADLTWDDVERVEFPGFGAAWEGIINDQADAAFAVTTSGQAFQLEASPRGLVWPTLPFDDEEGWARLNDAAPFFVPNRATLGAGLSEDNPHEGPNYPYPILLSYADAETDKVYAMTKAMVELFPVYDGAAPGISGWHIDRQQFEWVVPYHEGAIRYFEEIGVWTEDHQAHNDGLVERQQVLKAAWDAFVAEGVSDEEAFQEGWMQARRDALEAAGMNPIWN